MPHIRYEVPFWEDDVQGKLAFSVSALMSMLLSDPSYAQGNLHLLGNFLGDSHATVDTHFLAMKYTRKGNAYPKCDKVFNPIIEELRKVNTVEVPQGMLDCTEIYTNAKSTVTAQFLLSPNGYKLLGLAHEYKTRAPARDELARFSELYGQPDWSTEGISRWYTNTTDLSPYFQYGRLGDQATVYMTGSKLMREVFYEQVGKMVRGEIDQAGVSLSSSVKPGVRPTFPEELQWTWADDISGCEAELTRGFVIDSGSVNFYDGPEKLVKIEGPTVWRSPKGAAKTYLFTFVTDTSEEMGNKEARSKPYTKRYTFIGKELYVSDPNKLGSAQLTVKNRHIKCPKKRYN